jgi:hypothetical protein
MPHPISLARSIAIEIKHLAARRPLTPDDQERIGRGAARIAELLGGRPPEPAPLLRGLRRLFRAEEAWNPEPSEEFTSHAATAAARHLARVVDLGVSVPELRPDGEGGLEVVWVAWPKEVRLSCRAARGQSHYASHSLRGVSLGTKRAESLRELLLWLKEGPA